MANVRKHRKRIEEIDEEYEKERLELDSITNEQEKLYNQMKADLEKDINKLQSNVEEKE